MDNIYSFSLLNSNKKHSKIIYSSTIKQPVCIFKHTALLNKGWNTIRYNVKTIILIRYNDNACINKYNNDTKQFLMNNNNIYSNNMNNKYL